MGGTPTIDWSKYATPAAAPQIDWAKYETPSQPQDTGVLASLKRNTIGAVEGLYRAFSDPATNVEKQQLLTKVQAENARGGNLPETLATNPSRATLAYHRLIDAPADVLAKKGSDERAAAHELISNGQIWKGANTYLSGLTDTALSAVPMAGPGVNVTAQRAEQGDLSGAATDVASLVAAENAPAAARALGGKISDVMPSAMKARATEGFQEVSAAVGKHEVPMTDAFSDSMMNYQKLVDAGGSRSLAVSKLLNRITDPTKGPLTYDEARLFQSNISRLSADEAQRLTPVMKRAVGQIASSLNDSVSTTAESGGKLDQFQKAMSDWHKASKVQDVHDAVMDAIKKHGLQGATYGVFGAGAGYAIKKAIESALGR
jgi:hypothetical protein